MNKKSMGGSCLLSCQFEIRVVGGAATYHSKNGHYKIQRDKLYYFEICIIFLDFCKSPPPTLDI